MYPAEIFLILCLSLTILQAGRLPKAGRMLKAGRLPLRGGHRYNILGVIALRDPTEPLDNYAVRSFFDSSKQIQGKVSKEISEQDLFGDAKVVYLTIPSKTKISIWQNVQEQSKDLNDQGVRDVKEVVKQLMRSRRLDQPLPRLVYEFNELVA